MKISTKSIKEMVRVAMDSSMHASLFSRSLPPLERDQEISNLSRNIRQRSRSKDIVVIVVEK